MQLFLCTTVSSSDHRLHLWLNSWILFQQPHKESFWADKQNIIVRNSSANVYKITTSYAFMHRLWVEMASCEQSMEKMTLCLHSYLLLFLFPCYETLPSIFPKLPPESTQTFLLSFRFLFRRKQLAVRCIHVFQETGKQIAKHWITWANIQFRFTFNPKKPKSTGL